MIKGSEVRKADYAIERFLIDRWSPRAMAGEEISQKDLMRLIFENFFQSLPLAVVG